MVHFDNYLLTAIHHQRDRASPVAWVRKPYQGREAIRRESSRLQTSRPNTHQRDRASPVANLRETLPLGAPSPTPNTQHPTTNNQQPTSNNQLTKIIMGAHTSVRPKYYQSQKAKF
ncbi:MAG: hypothetical protein ACHBN1_10785 [Heteroscytonema crispum UTEX LB 1556]